jgi:WD40 repeat protein
MTAAGFYVVGGVVPRDAFSYVQRDADEQIYKALETGQFCYVLTPRQMGKSSLMANAAARLSAAGVRVAAIDMSGIGNELDAAQWYNGLLYQLGQQLGLEEPLENFILAHLALSPLQRWQRALREVVLARLPSQVVIFLDEIDVTRSLPFSTDELFAAIRACYNARVQDDAYQRLTFCLLGVATPTDLIRNPRLTPFNIGTRIELRDFTPAEAEPLRAGLGRDIEVSQVLMQRILYWTGGHPYLTQRLCQAVAAEPAALNVRDVDRLCRNLFLTAAGPVRDDNLLYLQQRLLPTEARERISLLTLYSQIHSGRRIVHTETIPGIDQLKLSGAVRIENGVLRARNRIYAHVFDRNWIRAHMPGEELRRQRVAYWRGVAGTAMASSLIVAAIGVFAAMAFVQARLARRASLVALQQAGMARRQAQIAQHNLYIADINVAQRAWEDGDANRTATLVAQHLPSDQEPPPAFEWRLLWTALHGEVATLAGHSSLVQSIACSPDGRLLASGGFDGTVVLWNMRTHRLIRRFRPGRTACLTFSPAGDLLAGGCDDGSVHLWHLATEQEAPVLPARASAVRRIVFAPDGKRLAAGYADGVLLQWDLQRRKRISLIHTHNTFDTLAYTPDGRRLLTTRGDYAVHILDLQTERDTRFGFHPDNISALALSADGRILVTGDMRGSIRMWNFKSKQLRFQLPAHGAWVNDLVLSPDGNLLASASWDYTARFWNLSTRTYQELKGHTDRVNAVAFVPGSNLIATGSSDTTIKLWNVVIGQPHISLPPNSSTGQQRPFRKQEFDQPGIPIDDSCARLAALSADGRTFAILAAGSDDRITVWNLETHSPIRTFSYLHQHVQSVALSPDASWLAVGYEHGQVVVWNIGTGPYHILHSNDGSRVSSITFAPDGQRLVSVNQKGQINCWNVVTLQWIAALRSMPHLTQRLALAPDGRTLAVASGKPGQISIWDLFTKCLMFTLRGQHIDIINQVAFSPDGRILATCGWEGLVVLWDLSTRQKLATFQAHKGPVNVIAISRDGRTLATGGDDGVIKLWDLQTQREVGIWHQHRQPIRFLAFAGKTETTLLVSCSGDQARLWRAQPWSAIQTHLLRAH